MKLKYCMVVLKETHIPRALSKRIEKLTGLYQWLNIFDGEILSLSNMDPHALEYYDVLHVNLCIGNDKVIPQLKEMLPKGSSTKIICNFDYAVEMIPSSFNTPSHTLDNVTKSMRLADMVFCQEPTQQRFFQEWTDKKIHLIPHPCNTKYAKGFHSPQSLKEPTIGVMFHRWDKNTLNLSTVTHVDWYDYKVKLLGHENKDGRVEYGKFDEVLELDDYPSFLDTLSRCKVLYDGYLFHTYGRVICDAACVGVPVVGSKLIASARLLYPNWLVDPYGIETNRNKIAALLEDPEIWQEAVDYAYKKVEHYSLKKSRYRMVRAIEGCK